MHKAERPSNYFSNSFTHYQANGVICVQILLDIHQTEHSRVHVQCLTVPFTQLSWSQ